MDGNFHITEHVGVKCAWSNVALGEQNGKEYIQDTVYSTCVDRCLGRVSHS